MGIKIPKELKLVFKQTNLEVNLMAVEKPVPAKKVDAIKVEPKKVDP